GTAALRKSALLDQAGGRRAVDLARRRAVDRRRRLLLDHGAGATRLEAADLVAAGRRVRLRDDRALSARSCYAGELCRVRGHVDLDDPARLDDEADNCDRPRVPSDDHTCVAVDDRRLSVRGQTGAACQHPPRDVLGTDDGLAFAVWTGVDTED